MCEDERSRSDKHVVTGRADPGDLQPVGIEEEPGRVLAGVQAVAGPGAAQPRHRQNRRLQQPRRPHQATRPPIRQRPQRLLRRATLHFPPRPIRECFLFCFVLILVDSIGICLL